MRPCASIWTVLIASLPAMLACGHSTNIRNEQQPSEIVELDLQVTYDQYLAETRSQDTSTREMHGIILASNEIDVINVTGKRQLVGYIYRIEGYLNGRHVVYIGSAASIKGSLECEARLGKTASARDHGNLCKEGLCGDRRRSFQSRNATERTARGAALHGGIRATASREASWRQ